MTFVMEDLRCYSHHKKWFVGWSFQWFEAMSVGGCTSVVLAVRWLELGIQLLAGPKESGRTRKFNFGDLFYIFLYFLCYILLESINRIFPLDQLKQVTTGNIFLICILIWFRFKYCWLVVNWRGILNQPTMIVLGLLLGRGRHPFLCGRLRKEKGWFILLVFYQNLVSPHRTHPNQIMLSLSSMWAVHPFNSQ